MKKFGLLASVALVVLVSPFVSAVEPLDDARIEIISQNCSEAQATMQGVLRSDAASRANRGRAYEETIKLLAAFNSRAALNTFNVPQLIELTSDFESEFTEFKTTYIAYSIAMSEAIRMNCSSQPVTFYDALTSVREQRAELSAKIKAMDQILDEYRVGLTVVEEEIAERNAE